MEETPTAAEQPGLTETASRSRLVYLVRARRVLSAASSPASALERELLDAAHDLRRLPGVACAVAQQGYGAPAGEESREADALGADARYASYLGRQLGATFGTGEEISSAVRRTRSRLLCFRMGHDLTIALLLSSSIPAASRGAIREVLAALEKRSGQGTEATRAARSRRSRRIGSMECDPQGRLLADTFRLARGPSLAQDTAHLLAEGIRGLEGPPGVVEAMEFRFRDTRLVLERTVRGFSLALWSGPAEMDALAWSEAEASSKVEVRAELADGLATGEVGHRGTTRSRALVLVKSGA